MVWTVVSTQTPIIVLTPFSQDAGNGPQVSVPFNVAGTITVTATCRGSTRSVDVTCVQGVLATATVVTAAGNPDNGRRTIGVGEQVRLTLTPTSLPTVTWVLAGNGSLSHPTENPITFTAPVRAANPTITATCEGVSSTVTFDVIEPQNATATRNGGDFYNGNHPTWAGQGMNLTVTLNPTTVSFSSVFVHEHKVPAANRQGYFANRSPRMHQPFDEARVRPDNTIVDTCYFNDSPPPWSGGSGKGAWVGGSMTWDIPLDWRCAPDKPWHFLQRNPQVFTITGANGGSTVSKFGITSGTRTP